MNKILQIFISLIFVLFATLLYIPCKIGYIFGEWYFNMLSDMIKILGRLEKENSK